MSNNTLSKREMTEGVVQHAIDQVKAAGAIRPELISYEQARIQARHVYHKYGYTPSDRTLIELTCIYQNVWVMLIRAF
jgi:hypothetical protein